MSTRSGKQIHKTVEEDVVEDKDVDCRRKTRSRRVNEKSEVNKRRDNYVSYPTTDDEQRPTDEKSVRSLRKKTLKEINVVVKDIKNVLEIKKCVSEVRVSSALRQTRRTKHVVEHIATDDDVDNDAIKISKTQKNETRRKGKVTQAKKENIENCTQKKSRKKKKSKNSNTSLKENVSQKSLNYTNSSVDSFHSAAGSPINNNVKNSCSKSKPKKINDTLSKSPAKDISHQLNTTFETVSDILANGSNSGLKKRNTSSSRANEECKKDIKVDVKDISVKLNTTFDKDDEPKCLDTTFEKDVKTQKRFIRQSNISKKDDDEDIISNKLDVTSENINSTFDKSTDGNTDTPVFNLTFDNDTKKNDNKSSTISSNSDITLDKSDDNMLKISITSDDSKSSTENILNATPVLIESSMDISKVTPSPPTKPENKSTLKREGTFTKDGPDPIIITEKRKSVVETVKTPTKARISLPSPGSTPFHSNTKTLQRQRSVMNVTRSIEKPTRLSSLGELAKSTKVMFCSPVDNPVMNTQRKNKIIKSSMKGSNKSFVFEEKSATKPASSRKRTLRQTETAAAGGAAEAPAGARAKRSRLADGLQQSVDRLSRPRTSSAHAKPVEATTPSKKPVTPRAESERKARPLPNFAALHQRQFQRMESLDECQERRAKRARQLLAPTGSLVVLERSSPKDPPTVTKETDRKPQPPSLIKTDGKKTYTRFGFKLNLDVNPFSIPSKNPVKVNGTVVNEIKKVHPTMNAVRKDVAKQMIMREKPATILKEKRNIKRDENRSIIKGVRTNRRFELQMRSRNING